MAGTVGFMLMERTTSDAGQTYQFTAAQYTALSDEERNAIQGVANYLEGENLEAPDDERLSSTFNILRPCDGCVPGEEIGADILLDIRRKFRFSFACFRFEEHLPAPPLYILSESPHHLRFTLLEARSCLEVRRMAGTGHSHNL